ncbi:MAG: hypothetical protein ACREVL_03480 [Solimonas sp.]
MKTAVRHTLLKVGVAALLCAPAMAMAYDYSYLEGGYLHRDQGGDDDGFRVAGSFDVLSPIAIFAEYDGVDDYDLLSVGALYHTPINNALDLVLGASFESIDNGHDDDTGFGLRGGVRWMVPRTRLELDPELRYVDYGHDDGLSVRLGAVYPITGALALQGGVQAGDDDRFDIGVRYNFGPQRSRN